MLVNDKIRANFPFPELIKMPTSLAIKLQQRIKYMFGITVEPVIIRKEESYFKTAAIGPLWSMRTKCGKYIISSCEKAAEMGAKSAWHVLDHPLFKCKNDLEITKFIY